MKMLEEGRVSSDVVSFDASLECTACGLKVSGSFAGSTSSEFLRADGMICPRCHEPKARIQPVREVQHDLRLPAGQEGGME